MTLEVPGAGTPAGKASATHDDRRARMLTGDGRMKAILVADDDAGTGHLLRGAPATVDGWVATAVADGAAVLCLLDSVQPDLIVLDVTLPGPDGVAVYQVLRAGAPRRRVPVLFRSGEARPRALRARAHEAEGCFRWLAKPFRLDDLLAVAADLLEDAPGGTTVRDGGWSARSARPGRAACCERNREPP
jgi:two-component system response regulator GlrR